MKVLVGTDRMARIAGRGALIALLAMVMLAGLPGMQGKAFAARRWRKAKASWYGPGFYGHTMAGGGKLRPNSMVLAHRTLPFGTKVEVRWRGRRVTAIVKDRGPYVRGRTFDLGPGVRWKLNFSGVRTIHYRIIKMGRRRH